MVEKKNTKKRTPAGTPAKAAAEKKAAAPVIRRRKAVPAEREEAAPAQAPKPQPARSGPPAMGLHELAPARGATRSRKRVGRGPGSGHGKTAGRGGKGQTARSGSSIRVGFEGGQMPLIRRIPKRGFNNARHTIRYVPVNLESLNQFDNGAKVDVEALRKTGLANGPVQLVKILGDGDLTKKLTVIAHAFSASARSKIEAKGGSCEVLAASVPASKPSPAKAPPAPTR